MQPTNFDVEKLAKITANILLERSFSPDDLGKTPVARNPDPKNIWFGIWRAYSCEASDSLVLNQNKDLLSMKALKNWWQRDTNGFASLTKRLLNTRSTENEPLALTLAPRKRRFDLFLSEIEYFQELVNCCQIDRSGRRRLGMEFANNLSKRLRNHHHVECWLKTSQNNSFNKPKFNFLPIWRGTFDCVDSSCKNVIKAKLFREASCFRMRVEIIGNNRHEIPIEKRPFCKGVTRDHEALEISSKGVLLRRCENILDEGRFFCDKVVRSETLRRIKSDYKNQGRISSDVFTDAKACKSVTDEMCGISGCRIKGYIQEVGLDPYGLLLLSGIQLEILWSSCEAQQWPVWYFDATGTVHVDIPRTKKKPFLFSLVFHLQQHGKYITAADFVTTEHDQLTIGSYLHKIKTAFINRHEIKLPKVIVTDKALALINACLATFNNGISLNTYLSWCYEFLLYNKPLPAELQVRHYICAVHILRIFRRNCKIPSIDPRVFSDFLFGVSFLITSKTLDQVDFFFNLLLDIFLFPVLDPSLDVSIEALNKKILMRHYDFVEQERTPLEKERDLLFDNFMETDPKYENAIKKKSPFYYYYQSKILNKKKEILKRIEHINANKNPLDQLENSPYFQPEFISLLLDQLSLMPLWTAVMIPEKLKVNRLTNNPAESYFRIVKDFLKCNLLYPSQLVTTLYKRMLAECKDIFPKYFEQGSTPATPAPPPLAIEPWHPKIKKIKKGKKGGGLFKDFVTEVRKQVQMPVNLNELQQKQKLTKLITIFNDMENCSDYVNLEALFSREASFLRTVIEILRKLTPCSEFTSQNQQPGFKQALALPVSFFPIQTNSDNNCLYNAISIIFFSQLFENCQKYFFIIKVCSIFILFEYKNFFSKLLSSDPDTRGETQNFESFVLNRSKKNVWACEIIISAISLLFDKKIVCISDPQLQTIYWNKEPSIMIAHHSSHFVPIFTKKDQLDGTEAMDQDQYFSQHHIFDCSWVDLKRYS